MQRAAPSPCGVHPLLLLAVCLSFLSCRVPDAASANDNQAIDLTRPPEQRERPDPGLVPCAKTEAGQANPGACGRYTLPAGAREFTVAPTVWRVPVLKTDPVLGPKDALVTAVVFSDFECPFCKRASDTFQAMLAAHPEQFRLVWKDNPMPSHHRAGEAAHFARSAYAQAGNEGFWKAHDALFARQPDFEVQDLFEITRDIHIRWDIARGDIREERHGLLIMEGIQLSDQLGVKAAPTTFVNGRKVIGSKAPEIFESLFKEELAKAEQLVRDGTAPIDVYAKIMTDAQESAP
ncbi:MAG: thioredoxin domain-containing protein [Polyangiaceae bacterium]|nr:thioredoxin domain-containing protein [Polyangiaceae bacterium]